MKHWKGITLSVCLLALLAVVLAVRVIANQPARGTVDSSANATFTPTAADERSDVQTEYLSFSYPKRYQIQTNQPKLPDLLEYRLLVSPSNEQNRASQIGISVRNLPAGGVTESTSYQLYATRPETYTLQKVTYAGDEAMAAVKKGDSYERTVLWPHGTYLLIITQTAASKSNILDSELDALLASLTWLR